MSHTVKNKLALPGYRTLFQLGERQELSYRESKPDAQAKDPVRSVLRLRVRLQWGSFFMPLA